MYLMCLHVEHRTEPPPPLSTRQRLDKKSEEKKRNKFLLIKQPKSTEQARSAQLASWTWDKKKNFLFLLWKVENWAGWLFCMIRVPCLNQDNPESFILKCSCLLLSRSVVNYVIMVQKVFLVCASSQRQGKGAAAVDNVDQVAKEEPELEAKSLLSTFA